MNTLFKKTAISALAIAILQGCGGGGGGGGTTGGGNGDNEPDPGVSYGDPDLRYIVEDFATLLPNYQQIILDHSGAERAVANANILTINNLDRSTSLEIIAELVELEEVGAIKVNHKARSRNLLSRPAIVDDLLAFENDIRITLADEALEDEANFASTLGPYMAEYLDQLSQEYFLEDPLVLDFAYIDNYTVNEAWAEQDEWSNWNDRFDGFESITYDLGGEQAGELIINPYTRVSVDDLMQVNYENMTEETCFIYSDILQYRSMGYCNYEAVLIQAGETDELAFNFYQNLTKLVQLFRDNPYYIDDMYEAIVDPEFPTELTTEWRGEIGHVWRHDGVTIHSSSIYFENDGFTVQIDDLPREACVIVGEQAVTSNLYREVDIGGIATTVGDVYKGCNDLDSNSVILNLFVVEEGIIAG